MNKEIYFSKADLCSPSGTLYSATVTQLQVANTPYREISCCDYFAKSSYFIRLNYRTKQQEDIIIKV
jgi:hypothetical protein